MALKSSPICTCGLVRGWGKGGIWGPRAGMGLTGPVLAPPTTPGQQSSRDEQGACAVLAVHLNTLLGERPVQHREVQGNESDLFMSYFPRGLKYQVSLARGFSQPPHFQLVFTLQKAQVPLGLGPPHLSTCLPLGWGTQGPGPPTSPLSQAIWTAGRWSGVSISQDLPRGHPSCYQETLPGEGEEEHPCP